ncbi:unnamed protein product [Moneuplotes crassus]|uniref:tRNA (GuanineN(7))methyltransferase n=1 Tax=Euplotes crassus TaxID=5936 RepID=A0AAD1XMQ9_EUPCR|nr:unnamed protein product [Moneuplotes crassus]
MDKEENKKEGSSLIEEDKHMEEFEIEPKDKLNQEEVDKAEKLINQRYPLNNLALHEVFTFLKPLVFWRKKANKAKQTSLKFTKLVTSEAAYADMKADKLGGLKGLVKKHRKSSNRVVEEAAKSQQEMVDCEPLNLLGIGIVAQFDLMKYLIIAFILFTLLSIPMIVIYSGYDNMRGTKKESYTAPTLGNFGFSTSSCYTVPKKMESMILFCNTGTLSAKIGSYGIVPSDAEDRNVCIDGIGDTAACSSRISADFELQYETECSNKKFCILKHVSQHFNGPEDRCNNENSIFFLNVKCLQDIEVVESKRAQSFYIMTIGLFMGLSLLVTLYYAQNKLKISAKEWDLDMITASDYTVSYEIDQDDYEFFKEQHREESGESAPLAYMSVLKHRVENQVSKEEFVIHETNVIKIANITYSFNNHEMIELLDQRGTAIANHDMKKKIEIEKEIYELGENNRDQISTPSLAYITFETQEGYERAIKMTSRLQSVFSPAVEPTNIIWENSHYSWTHIFTRLAIVISIMFILLIIAFAIFFYLKRGLSVANGKYMNLNCDSFNKNIENDSMRLRYALIDYFDYYESKLENRMTGALQCFCDQFYAERGLFATLNNYFQHPKVTVDGNRYEEQICREWAKDLLFAPFWSSVVSIVIVFLNYLLREGVIYMSHRVGFHTETSQATVIMVFVFIAQFLNTSILINFVNANTTEAFSNMGIFKGGYPDFNFNWYSDIGASIVFTMMFNTLWPFIEVALDFGMSLFFRILDKGLTCNKYKTRSKTIQQYIDLYSGPEYLVHFKYSRILNIVFTSFTYGLAIPWLFPIGLITLVIDYIVDKLCIVYYYREPPSYDNKLNKATISLMQWAPLFMFGVGFWMFSNRQIFENYVELDTQSKPIAEKTGHTLFENVTATPAYILYISFFILLFGLVFKKLISYILRKTPFLIRINNQLDEHLPNYSDALDYCDSMYLMSMERHLRKHYGVKTIMDQTLSAIVSAQPTHKKITGIGVYDILANIRYCDKFQYDYYDQVLKMNFNDESTKVKLWLSVGFMTKDTRLPKPSIKANSLLSHLKESLFDGMINHDVDEQIERKTINFGMNAYLSLIEKSEEKNQIEDKVEECDEDEEDDKEKGLLADFK